MTRTERIATNPNHPVGHHPLTHSDPLDPYYPEECWRQRCLLPKSTKPRDEKMLEFVRALSGRV